MVILRMLIQLQASILLTNHGRKFKEAKGLIVKIYEQLESYAITSLMNDFENAAPVYTVALVIDLRAESGKSVSDDETQRDEIKKWLDDQPDSPVVF